MAKTIKVSEVRKGQRVRVESHDGMREGEVTEITREEDRADPAVWVTVRTGESGFIDSMHDPDGEIELAD